MRSALAEACGLCACAMLSYSGGCGGGVFRLEHCDWYIRRTRLCLAYIPTKSEEKGRGKGKEKEKENQLHDDVDDKHTRTYCRVYTG